MTSLEVMTSLGQPAWSATDDESLNLILSLLHDDARQITFTSKGKGVEGTCSDADLALQLHTEELDRATTYLSDRRMTRSVQGAVQTDIHALLASELQESVARGDRAIAIAQSAGTPHGQTQTPVNTGPSAAELETWNKLKSTYITGSGKVRGDEVSDDRIETMSTEMDSQPESSSWAASRGAFKSHNRPCVACCNVHNVIDLAQAPCQHDYCRKCLETLFRNSMVDESLFPPRCCRVDIPVDANRLFLGNDLVHQFMEKSIELATPNRIYCHQPTCSAFIPPSMIKDGVAPCPKCKTQTCVTCKGGTHKGDCPSDTALQQVLKVARQERWQRCPKCSTMIELNTGCYHITCECRAQFCYLCGAPWKTCLCAQWDEDRLYNRAQQIHNQDHNPNNANLRAGVANPVNPRPAAVENRTAKIGRIREHLPENHECDHEEWNRLRWVSRLGPEDCGKCGIEMANSMDSMYECLQCSLMACRSCCRTAFKGFMGPRR